MAGTPGIVFFGKCRHVDVVLFPLPVGKAKGVICCDSLKLLFNDEQISPVPDGEHGSLMGEVNRNTPVHCISARFIASNVVVQIYKRWKRSAIQLLPLYN